MPLELYFALPCALNIKQFERFAAVGKQKSADLAALFAK
jgi:hypothetical protein